MTVSVTGEPTIAEVADTSTVDRVADGAAAPTSKGSEAMKAPSSADVRTSTWYCLATVGTTMPCTVRVTAVPPWIWEEVSVITSGDEDVPRPDTDVVTALCPETS